MHGLAALREDLAVIGLSSWSEPLEPLLHDRMANGAHGKLAEWRRILSSLPDIARRDPRLDTDVVVIGDDGPAYIAAEIRELLLRLIPWRKGPFRVHGVDIDSEWQSNLKWDRVRDEISPLEDRAVLDVGCGNGYYALRMRGLGARVVVGVDPTLQHVVQFLALQHFMTRQPVHILPLRLDELPPGPAAFDTAFSMGVLYHRREPEAHLAELHAAIRPGGELVLETLILPGSDTVARTPENRYARMRNVWHLPTQSRLAGWLRGQGFEDIRLADVSVTGIDEQRSTEWMPYESLAEALDPRDPSTTVEGWPAPRRAVYVCRKP